jgi:hypothetical protein
MFSPLGFLEDLPEHLRELVDVPVGRESRSIGRTEVVPGRRAKCDRRSLVDTDLVMDVPEQFFQSVIAIELAVTGALLWQIRYFESRDAPRRDSERLPDPRLRLGLALVLSATLFGSIWAMADEGPKWAALAVTLGLAISVIPILLRVLSPLAKDAATNERDPGYAVTVLALVGYTAVVTGFLVLLDVE